MIIKNTCFAETSATKNQTHRERIRKKTINGEYIKLKVFLEICSIEDEDKYRY